MDGEEDIKARCLDELLEGAFAKNDPVVQFLLEKKAMRRDGFHDAATLEKIKSKYLGELLEEAINKNHDVAVVRLLLKQKAPVSDALLVSAVDKANDEKVSALLLFAAKASFTEKAKQTTLTKAVLNGFVSTVILLVSKGPNGHRHIDPNFLVYEESKLTPLHLAVRNLEIAKALLENGADPNAQDVNKKTALHLVGEHYLVARILIQHGGNPDMQDIREDSALHKVCRDGHLETAKELAWADPNARNKKGQTPLYAACRAGRMDMVTWLVKEAGANPREWAKVPPFEAAYKGQLMPKALIDLGFNPWQQGGDGDTIAHACMRFISGDDSDYETQSFRYRFADELFSCDPTLVRATGFHHSTPLHCAASDTSPSMVRLLVEKYGADLMAKTCSGRIPLYFAVAEKKGALVECILVLMNGQGLCIDEPSKNGWTALHYAIFWRQDECMDLLLQYGADCNKVNEKGQTPLHLFGFPFPPPIISRRRYSEFDITQVLNSKGFPGWKAAQDEIRMESLMELLSRGIDVTLPDKDGNLPFFLAAVTSRVPEAFLMIRSAASQGLFERNWPTQEPGDKKRKANDSPKRNDKRSKSDSGSCVE